MFDEPGFSERSFTDHFDFFVHLFRWAGWSEFERNNSIIAGWSSAYQCTIAISKTNIQYAFSGTHYLTNYDFHLHLEFSDSNLWSHFSVL